MKELIDVEKALLDFHVHEVQHHRDKIRWLIALLLSSSASILVYQRPQFFNTDQLEWPILIGGLILLTGIYYALAHHTIKLLTKCKERDIHQRVLRELRNKLLPKVLPDRQVDEKFDFNLSIISGPIAILLVTSMAWLSLFVFLNRVLVTSNAVEKVQQALPTITSLDELKATNANIYVLVQKQIKDMNTIQSRLPALLVQMKTEVERAQSVTVVLMIVWGTISLGCAVVIAVRFSGYWKAHKGLFATAP